MILVCPHCELECTVDDKSAETVTCPGCGIPLSADTTNKGPPETRIAPPTVVPQNSVVTQDVELPGVDLLPSPAQLPRQMGRYLLTKLLGGGGFGHVYQAFDPQLDREIALKIPRKDRLSANQDLNRFLDEARLCAKLEHPGIVRVYDVGWLTPDICFIAMELCAGGSLAGITRRNQKLPPRQATEFVAEIAEAIHFAHLRALVHRDLKPSNILFGTDGRPRIADFGLALTESLQWNHLGEVAGTLPYMSPEQVRGESHLLDGRSDIWSLGAIFYELLTGRRPFLGQHTQIAEQILRRDPKPLRQLSEEIPVELEQICLKCLQKPVADRWSTAKDLADALRQWLNISSSNSAPITLPIPPAPAASEWWRTGAGRAIMVTGFLFVAGLLGFALPVNKSNSSGNSASPVVPDWNMAQVVPFRQYPLFLKPSQKLAWPIPGESASVDHSLDEAKLNITSDQMTLIELGDTISTDFKLDVDIYKSARTGSAGVFWGYRADPIKERESHCYALFYKTFLRRHGDPSINLIVVSDLTFTRFETGEVSLSAQRDIGSQVVPPVVPQGSHLMAKIGPSGLVDVQWNGQVLPEIKKLWIQDQLELRGVIPAHRPVGRFGIMNQLGSTLFRNATFTSLKVNAR